MRENKSKREALLIGPWRKRPHKAPSGIANHYAAPGEIIISLGVPFGNEIDLGNWWAGRYQHSQVTVRTGQLRTIAGNTTDGKEQPATVQVVRIIPLLVILTRVTKRRKKKDHGRCRRRSDPVRQRPNAAQMQSRRALLTCHYQRRNRSIRVGDTVQTKSTAPFRAAAIVTGVDSIVDCDGQRINTGIGHLQVWVAKDSAFAVPKCNVELRHFGLMPSCCGQICCPNLQVSAEKRAELLDGYRAIGKLAKVVRPKRKTFEELYYGSDYCSDEGGSKYADGRPKSDSDSDSCDSDCEISICEDVPDA